MVDLIAVENEVVPGALRILEIVACDVSVEDISAWAEAAFVNANSKLSERTFRFPLIEIFECFMTEHKVKVKHGNTNVI
jgi:hypothetical protein